MGGRDLVCGSNTSARGPRSFGGSWAKVSSRIPATPASGQTARVFAESCHSFPKLGGRVGVGEASIGSNPRGRGFPPTPSCGGDEGWLDVDLAGDGQHSVAGHLHALAVEAEPELAAAFGEL